MKNDDAIFRLYSESFEKFIRDVLYVEIKVEQPKRLWAVFDKGDFSVIKGWSRQGDMLPKDEYDTKLYISASLTCGSCGVKGSCGRWEKNTDPACTAHVDEPDMVKIEIIPKVEVKKP